MADESEDKQVLCIKIFYENKDSFPTFREQKNLMNAITSVDNFSNQK